MDLILWRHAEAQARRPRQADLERELTGKGRKQAKKMADWLGVRLKRDYTMLVSPAVCSRQTAQALGGRYEICDELGEAASARRLLKASGWPQRHETVVLVGHQPGLNRLAALLLTGRESEWDMKKGALWWLQSRGDGERAAIRAILNPKDL